jgi:regulator of replication initiation timing
MTAAVVEALRKAPREITTVSENCENSACTNAQESQQTMSTLVDKVESLADSVALLAESVKILQHENSQKRNRMTSPKTPDTEMKDADSSSPPSKQQKARAPSPMLPQPPKGHPMQQLTNGAQGGT